MTATKQADKFLIAMPIFGVKTNSETGKLKLSLCSIINYGDDLGSGKLKYVNKEGEQTRTIKSFASCIHIYKIDQLDLDHLMSDWQRENNCYLPVVLDNSISIGEVYQNKFSPIKVMIEKREKETAIKLLFD